jgi:hypothetical protein
MIVMTVRFGSISAGQAQITSHRPEVTLWPGAVLQSLQAWATAPRLWTSRSQYASTVAAFGVSPELHQQVAFSKPVRNSFQSGRDTALDGHYKDLVLGLERRCSAGFR